ncbi:hypothetical protein NDU88_000922 [Pleurodeles waltl]|uniref:G-protein coupled receptors family 1 profile domain-containing protein n=2 Tax=Pleurodeles waltl TaxID=8319 RepID=A0AAV7PB30_PLEWA|nr:hypothetical protein NDU88_000922 [Pleurodeles waltl]
MHIIACWTLAICFAYVPVFGYNNQELLRQAAANGSGVTWLTPRGQLHVICQNLVVLNLDYLVYVLFVVCTLLPVLATTALYLLMLLRVGSGHQARVAATAHVAEGLHERKQRRLTANMLLALLAYVLLKIPYNALNCVFLYCPTCQVPYWAVPFTFSLILCSAVFNPFIVFLTHKQARDWCCRAAGCRRRWKRETVVSLVRVAERSVKT